jgi:hypothetical protein
MSSLWEQRAARNEALFREVNENIARLEQRFGGSAPEPTFICECSNELCTEHIYVDTETYRQVRAHPRRFIVLRGHVEQTLEGVIDERDGYLIVEKTGAAGEIVEQSA